MRNTIHSLSMAQAAQASSMRDALRMAQDMSQRVTIVSESRTTGEVSTRSGMVLEFAGELGMSSGAVKVDTAAGPRTLNLHLIHSVTIGA